MVEAVDPVLEKAKAGLIAVVILVIGVQIVWAVLQPYMHMIGLTLAMAIIIIIIGGLAFGGYIVYQRYFRGGGRGGM
jgi:hypothetical protein